MFNEKSNVWLDLYKGIIMVGFWLICAGIVLYGVAGIIAFVSATMVVDGRVVLLFFAQFIGLIIGAFLWYVVGMLSLNFLNNVQLIRERLENREEYSFCEDNGYVRK